MVLFPKSLELMIPEDHQVRLLLYGMKRAVSRFRPREVSHTFRHVVYDHRSTSPAGGPGKEGDQNKSLFVPFAVQSFRKGMTR